MTKKSLLCALVTTSAMVVMISGQLKAQGNGVVVSSAVRADVSLPLRSLNAASSPGSEQRREKPLRPIPQNEAATNGDDSAVQTAPGAFVTTSAGFSFAGVGNGDYGFVPNAAPPDTNGAVGATQYVQWVNESFAVFAKGGQIASGFPKAGNSPWVGFGGGCETNNDGDPVVQYDKAAGRWILTQFSVKTPPYLECIAVSQTSDATGAYYRYAFSYGNTEFPDYPKVGVWPDAYYFSYNIFNNGTTFGGSKACAMDRAKMLVGDPTATQQCFQLSTSFGGLLPSDLDGITAPPAGSPNFFLNYGTNKLNLWKFHVDWANSANSTFTGPTAIAVATFNAACSGGGTCIPQPGTNQKLDSLADRLMYRLAYRNRAGVESLVVNQSVAVGSNKRNAVTSVRWYELRNPAASTMAVGIPVVFQQGTLGTSDGTHRWMGSIAMDKAGNIALGYSASSASVAPSIRFTARAPGDVLGTMQVESILKAGGGSQLTNLNRWGDYSAMTVDPVDDCTFWYTNEYLKTSGTFNWSTYISNFKLPGCQ